MTDFRQDNAACLVKQNELRHENALRFSREDGGEPRCGDFACVAGLLDGYAVERRPGK